MSLEKSQKLFDTQFAPLSLRALKFYVIVKFQPQRT